MTNSVNLNIITLNTRIETYDQGGLPVELTKGKSFWQIDYEDMTDEEIIKAFNKGDMCALEYILIKYKAIVKWNARSYYLVGGDKEDLIQEGMIGLYKAILDYDKKRLPCFRAFADICITRHIITAIKTATRQKHIPLNSYISLNKPVYENRPNITLLDIIGESKIIDPEALVIGEEYLENMEEKIEMTLSKLELEVLLLYIDGLSYEEIALEMNRHVKTVDNALQRIKRKLEHFLNKN